MKYLKVFVDFADKIELLGDAERGRLFTAMLKYASSGAEPDLRGNERFIWQTAKSEIDRQAESYKSICETNKRIATERYGALRTVTERNGACQDKDKDKDKDKEDLPASSNEDARPSDAGRSAEKAVIDAWNSLGLNPIRSVNQGSDRKRILASRITNDGVPAILEAIENVRRSPFLNGQSKGGFTASFDWFIKPSNFQKVLEGRYNDATQKTSAPSGRRDDTERLEKILAKIAKENEKE